MKTKVIIIAEAGVNHNGSIETAKKLVDAAVDAGVDYVKFQSFKASSLVSKHAVKAAYQKAQTDSTESQLEMLQKLELSEADHYDLLKYCQFKQIKFLSTAFDIESIELLKSLGMTLGKIPSGEMTNLPYLRKMAASFPEIIFSTGMCSMEDIQNTYDVLIKEGTRPENITVLHCNTEYPTPMQDVHLKAMNTIREKFNVKVGYSDHTLGIEIPIAAVAIGASVIEKHFTLDKNAKGPDHKASLEPAELKAMASAIRNIELALGSSLKQMSASEEKNKTIARKSLVAKWHINKGEIFTEENITAKRPGDGISPMFIDEVLGKIAKQNFEADQPIEL